MTELTTDQLHILQHALGADQYGQIDHQRNQYVSSPTPDLLALVSAGLMHDHGYRELFQGHCYTVTDTGRAAMLAASPAPPKLTRAQKRYQQYLEWSDPCGGTFREFLKAVRT